MGDELSALKSILCNENKNRCFHIQTRIGKITFSSLHPKRRDQLEPKPKLTALFGDFYVCLYCHSPGQTYRQVV